MKSRSARVCIVAFAILCSSLTAAEAAPCRNYPAAAARAIKPRVEALRFIEREASDRLTGLDTRPWPYLVAQGVPDNVVAVLRNAFDETMRSYDFRAEAARRGLDLDSTTGAEIQTLVENIYKTKPEVVTRVRKILDAAGR